MGFDLDADGLAEPLTATSREVAREAAGRWHSRYTEGLLKAGDEHDYNVFPVAQAALPPQWDAGAGGYVFRNPHPAALFFEDGTAPHEVTAGQADVLAFEWPEAPPGVRDMFEETFPTVFFPKVEVDGIERTDAFKEGRRDAARWLEGQR